MSADFLGFGLAAGGFFDMFEHDDIPESRLGALIKTFFFFLVFGGGGGGTGKRPVNEDMFQAIKFLKYHGQQTRN